MTIEKKLKKTSSTLYRAQEKIQYLEIEKQELQEEIAILRAESSQVNMYPEGIDHVVKQFEDFREEMKSFRKWLKWRLG